MSIEFQETGFLVHRLFRAGLNRVPPYREFIRDARELGRGVVVGRSGWEVQLEANQQSLAVELAARAEFTMAHGTLSNEQYVDALNTNSGGALSQAERDLLVAGLNGATETRASVLFRVADHVDFRADAVHHRSHTPHRDTRSVAPDCAPVLFPESGWLVASVQDSSSCSLVISR